MEFLYKNRKIRVKLKSLIITLLIILIVTGLFGTIYYYIQRNIAISKIELSNNIAKVEVFEEDQVKLSAQISNNDFINDIKWISSDENVLKVDEEGNIFAKKAGKATVLSSIKGCKKEGKTEIVIKPLIKLKEMSVSGIDINNIFTDMKIPLHISLIPENVSYKKLTFHSSDTNVAKVDNKGIINTVGTGRVNIDITCENNDVYKTLSFYVKKKKIPVKSISFIDGKQLTLENGDVHTLSVKFNPEKPDDKRLTFSSSDKTIASVSDDGKITTLRPGVVTITAKSTDGNKIASIYVIIKSDKGLLSKSTLDALDLNSSKKLMIVAHPDDETLWGGGHLLEGNWFVICLTNGYNAKRVTEFKNALAVSKSQYIILNYPDYKVKRIIDDWDYVKNGINHDIELILKYKNWDQIATHNPQGEYGHKHHKMTSKFVTNNSMKINILNKLYYFGTFYEPNEVPENLISNLDTQILNQKMHMVDQYPNQRKSIEALWMQMVPHEHWTKAK